MRFDHEKNRDNNTETRPGALSAPFVAEGETVRLRPMTEADCADVMRWRNHERVRLQYVYRELLTLEDELRYYREKVATGKVLHLILCDRKHGDRGVGCQVFNDMESFRADPENIPVEVGYFIGEDDALGTGIAVEGMQLGMRYAFETYGIRCLVGRIFADNLRSISASCRVGMKIVEDIPAVLCSDGVARDMKLVRITPKDLEEGMKQEEQRREQSK